MGTKKKPQVTFDLDMSAAATEEAFLSSTPDKKPKRDRKETPGWKCCSLWLPLEALEVLAADASRVQYKPEPNMSLYLRELVLKKVESLQRKGNSVC